MTYVTLVFLQLIVSFLKALSVFCCNVYSDNEFQILVILTDERKTF